MARFLFALHSEIASQIRRQILGGDTILELDVAFSRVLRITIGAPSSYTDQSAMVSTSHGPGHVRGRSSRSGWGNRRCEHCDCSNHVSKKCWAKFGRPEWTQQASVETSTSDTAILKLIVLPPDEYAQYVQFRAS